MTSNEEAIECTRKCIERGEDISLCFINCVIGDELLFEARKWIDVFKDLTVKVSKLYGFTNVLFSREFGSFIRDPRLHLRKKLFIYTHDLHRGRLKPGDYGPRAAAALRTSLRTNLRTLYQNWAFMGIIYNLYRDGVYVVYPEYKVLSLERSGKQRLRWIPPNLVLDIPGIGSLSFFIEVPRPLAWEDSSDLRESWKLYTALRPDIMVYGGRVMDIVDINSNPPIKKPDIIIECKELIDWYARIRDVRGPLAKPLTAEEWRNLWIQGLWDGLADVLGVTRREAIEEVKKRKGIRLNEVKIVELYRSVYNPKEMILISKYGVPNGIRRQLEGHDIIVIDNVGFDIDALSEVADRIKKYARHPDEYIFKIRDHEVAELIHRIIELLDSGRISLNELKYLIESYIST